MNPQAANWSALLAAIAQVQHPIATFAHALDSRLPAPGPPTPPPPISPTPLDRLCTLFHLTGFERDILLVCVGMELTPEFSALCGQVQGNEKLNYPTLLMMLQVFPESHWSAFTPEAPLRRWRLIELGEAQTLTQSPLRVDERILHYLLDEQYLDPRFQGLLQPVAAGAALVPSHGQLAQQMVGLWQQQRGAIVQLYGQEVAGKSAIVQVAAAKMQRTLYRLGAQAMPTSPGDVNALVLLWEREVRLSGGILLVSHESGHDLDPAKTIALMQLIAGIQSELIVTVRSRDRTLFADLPDTRPVISLEVQPPTSVEQRQLWQAALPAPVTGLAQEVAQEIAQEVASVIDPLVAQFSLNAPTIAAVCAEAATSPTPTSTASLWQLCRVQSRPQMDDLAERIEAIATWDDLVLPLPQKRILRAIAAQVKQRSQVYGQWGFGGQGSRGLGMSALFAGVSGTGKTMAAEVLARALALDLYRIDLSAVVSKYIGETEKNLRRVFDAAESGSVILLFDEADALFGKRSEVKDSHDRYANMEVSYLLQRMEAYQGLAILTTNLKDTLDTAFLRRLRFIIKFPFPDAAQRQEIWQRAFPKDTPVHELDLAKLARLNVAGGNIRNIALNAAFLAAADDRTGGDQAGQRVMMKHLLEAAASEYAKLERPLTDAEVRGWVKEAGAL